MADGYWLLRADQNTRVYLRIYDIVAEAGAPSQSHLCNRKRPHLSIAAHGTAPGSSGAPRIKLGCHALRVEHGVISVFGHGRRNVAEQAAVEPVPQAAKYKKARTRRAF